MWRQLGQRLVWMPFILIFVTLFVFVMLDLAPGDAATTIAGENATPQAIEQIRHELRLDEPLLTRYREWMTDAVQGDLGKDMVAGTPVADRIKEVLPKSLSLVVAAMVVALGFAFVFGATPMLFPRRQSLDRISTLISSASMSMPYFWVALLITAWFAVSHHVLPALGYVALTDNPWQWARHLVLPAVALGLPVGGELARQLRAGLQDVLAQDYALVLRAKGMSNHRVVLKHGLKNASVPVVTILGIRLAQILGSAVIIEQIFLIDGLGRLLVTAVLARNITVVLGVVVVSTLVVLLANLVVDVSYAYFNPKVRTR